MAQLGLELTLRILEQCCSLLRLVSLSRRLRFQSLTTSRLRVKRLLHSRYQASPVVLLQVESPRCVSPARLSTTMLFAQASHSMAQTSRRAMALEQWPISYFALTHMPVFQSHSEPRLFRWRRRLAAILSASRTAFSRCSPANRRLQFQLRL